MGNIYYIGGMPVSDELYHHGIKGQKWGIRRYQNADGSLTKEGRERYGKTLGEYGTKKPSLFRRMATGDMPLGVKRWGEKREARLYKEAEKRRAQGDITGSEKTKRAADVQKKKNIAREQYISRTSTGKIVLQNLLLGGYGATQYQAARGAGKDIGEALTTGLIGIVGDIAVPAVGGLPFMAVYESSKTGSLF